MSINIQKNELSKGKIVYVSLLQLNLINHRFSDEGVDLGLKITKFK